MAKRLVVEWTRATMRLAVAERRGRTARLLAVHSEPLGPSQDAARALRALLKAAKTPSDEIISVVPREQVITRTVKFPTVQPSELAQMVELYAKAQLPYPREQSLVDFSVMRQQEGFTSVAIAACQREVMDRHLAVLREAGLSVGLVTVSSWGVLGWYRTAATPGGGPRREPTLVIHVDDTRTDLVLLGEGHLLSSRSVGQGAQDWEASGEAVELLALEVERSRAAVRKELPGVDMHFLLFTGVGPLAQWADQLGQRLGLPAAASSAAASVSHVVVGGVACSDVRELLNLNPPEVKVHVRHRQQVRDLVTLSVLLMGVLAMGAGLLGVQISRQQRMTNQVDRLLGEIEPTAKHLQDKARTAKLVATMIEHRQRLAATLAGVFRTTPVSVTLEGVVYERARGEVVLRGSAPSTQDVLEYIRQLESLDGVQGVQLKYSTRRATPAGERTDFELLLHHGEAS